MSTATYASPLQEFWHVFIQGATAAVFNVVELVPPPGSRLIITNLEGSGASSNRWRIGVFSDTLITAGLATGSVLAHNPPGFAGIARAGTRADIALFGYITAPAFRAPFSLRTVVDSIAGQRFVAIYQVANEATEFSVKGYLTASELETDGRLIL